MKKMHRFTLASALILAALVIIGGAAMAQDRSTNWEVVARIDFDPATANYVVSDGEHTTFDGRPVIAGTGSDRWARVDFELNEPIVVAHERMKLRFVYRIDTEEAEILRLTWHPRTVSQKEGIIENRTLTGNISVGKWMVEEVDLVGLPPAGHSSVQEAIEVGDAISSIRIQSRAHNDNTHDHTITVLYVEFIAPID